MDSWCRPESVWNGWTVCAMIAEESRKLEGLEAEKKTLMDLCRRAGTFSDGSQRTDESVL